MTGNTSPAPSRKKLLIGTAAALGVAAVALVVFVLPAEYGIDPTGAGKALGVTKLAEAEEGNIYLERGQARTNVMFPLETGAAADETRLRATLAANNIAERPGTPLRTDRFEIKLMPYEAIELKYDLAEGAPIIFSWTAGGAPMHVDMHSHPFAGGEEMTESFVIEDKLPSQTAVYVAPYDGIHGWYWQNRTLDEVTLTLDATGQMTASRTFDAAGEHPRPLADEPGAASAGEASES